MINIHTSGIILSILPENINGITIAPFGIFIREEKFNHRILNHELIHWQQQLEMGFIFFYLLYLIEWIVKGYRSVSFEREAYDNDDNQDYLLTRKHYCWTKYLLD
jgi:hypothetical protein